MRHDEELLPYFFFPHRALTALAAIADRLRGDLRGGAGSMPKGNAHFDPAQPVKATSVVFSHCCGC